MSIEYFPLSGRIVLDDNLGHVVFDTDNEFLSGHPDDFVAGSVVVPQRVASSEGVDGSQVVVDVEVDYPLAAIEIPGAKVVRGMMRSTWDSNPEPADNLWRQASGTHIDILDGVSTTQVPQSDLSGYNRVATMGGYTFYVSDAGVLMLRERIVMRARDSGGPPTSYNRARRQATISFRLLIGFFLGADFSSKPSIAYVGGDAGIGTNSSSFSGTVNFGEPFPGRRCIVGVLLPRFDAPSARTVTGVTIGGVAATIHGQHTYTHASMAIASIPNEAAAALAVTVSASGDGSSGRIFFFVGRNIGTYLGLTTSNTNDSPIIAAMDVGDDEVGVTLGTGGFSYSVDEMTGVDVYANHDQTWAFFGITPTGADNGNITATGIRLSTGEAGDLIGMVGFKFGL